MSADASPPTPICPSWNSKPRYDFGHPSVDVEVIASPLHLMMFKTALNLFPCKSDCYFLKSSMALLLESELVD